MAPKAITFFLLLAGMIAGILAECPNACSAHGKCGQYDMCTCFRNWMSNDCSERICQFGLAHVDTPKGDLDASSGQLTDPDTVVIVNDAVYPYGTTEQYPAVKDSDENVLDNTAHEYRECSNKGICDRSTGSCQCFEGYEGSACQRASCPTGPNGVCSGHGTCQTIAELSQFDYYNNYRLWDADATMGCRCDAGYEGPDCSLRQCKYGVDPYYKDNNATIRFSNYTIEFYSLAANSATLNGNYSLVFYDHFGEDWQTEPITYNAPCSDIINALESLPNDVIPSGSVRCSIESTSQPSGFVPIRDTTMTIHYKYTIAFPGNPGELKQIEINKYLDGTRPTLYTTGETTSTLGWHIYSNGFYGEDVDVVPDRCEGVLVTLSGSAGSNVLAGISTDEFKLLRRCLGDSDGDSTNNIDTYNWDTGSLNNPHLIKLQEATQFLLHLYQTVDGDYDYDPTSPVVPVTTLCNSTTSTATCKNYNAPGFYAVTYWDGSNFVLLNNPAHDYDTTTQFYVYTTTGYLNRVSTTALGYTYLAAYSTQQKIDSYYSNLVHVMTHTIDCETSEGSSYNLDCLDRGDKVLFLSGSTLSLNPYYTNIYTVKKISGNAPRLNTLYCDVNDCTTDQYRSQIVLDKSLNVAFTATNPTHMYKFYPPTNAEGGYKYVTPCAGRGVCNTDNGLCECFPGYNGCDDACTCIFNLAE